MRKFLVVVITTLTLVLGLGGPMLTSADAKKPTRFIVSARVSSHTPISGEQVIVTGAVGPEGIGRKVVLQQRYNKHSGKWKRVAAARVRADAGFTFDVVPLYDFPNVDRTRWYRVVKPAGDGHRRGVSNKMKVNVEPWDGRVEFRLSWESGADLNLVFGRNPEFISEDEPGPSASGGLFDRASTSGCGGPGSFERIYWPNDNAPREQSTTQVELGEPCDGNTNPAWTAQAWVNGRLVSTVHGHGAQNAVINVGPGFPGW